MAERLTRIAIVSEDKCKPKKCRQECKKSCPVVKTGNFLYLSAFAVRAMEFTICPRVVLSNRSLDPFPRGNLSVE
jgi:hypothetical protein